MPNKYQVTSTILGRLTLACQSSFFYAWLIKSCSRSSIHIKYLSINLSLQLQNRNLRIMFAIDII